MAIATDIDALLSKSLHSPLPVEKEEDIVEVQPQQDVPVQKRARSKNGYMLRPPGQLDWREGLLPPVGYELEGQGGPKTDRIPTEAEFMEGFEPYVEPAPEPEPIKPAYRNPPSTLQEWQRLNPGMVTKPQQVEEEADIKVDPESLLGSMKHWQMIRERNDSPDEFAGFDEDGNPAWKRVQTGGDVKRPTGLPPSGDGAIDKAMDIYREAADNYPHDRPIDEQQGFAIAASTQDYNKGGWANEAPVAAEAVVYDGRRGEVREYAKGNRFFVSFDDDVILRMEDRK